ncbi:hypothetical protein PPERSA_09110 [Pseudocohnilembus persalinus]|uniref:Uncharacterized protein n=1 Tax=Pseudocohnilembus persalinus TaxID=266149 RepID=A0A0V0QWZ3_PSEPJ|nr:hypothetical protein PPERSA_09110 [Pseudocohnilembus persalinus]|eukprot:KRX06708.1 hypothetical protein PPERSA_09110 [Pseudocohnilembus persalinus]
MAQNPSNPDSSNDTHYIDMKVIAYRKKLEDEKIQQQEIEKQKIQIQDFKTSFYNAFKDQLKNSFINSLYYTVPLGTGLMVARKSLLIVPFTMFLGFTGQFYYDLKTKGLTCEIQQIKENVQE